jgi:hypothetical protein
MKRLATEAKRAHQQDQRKRIKKREADAKKVKKQDPKGRATGGIKDRGKAVDRKEWVPVPIRNDRGHVLYDSKGHVRYHPHNEPTKKKKPPTRPPSRRPEAPSSPTMPMAMSTPTATRTSTRSRTVPVRLRDYVHGLLRPLLGHTWSPKPQYTRWLYEGVILPMLT